MTAKYLLLIFALALSQSAFAQNKSTEKRPQAYLVSRGEVRVTVNRPRVHQPAPAKTVAKSKSSDALDLERRAFGLINEHRAATGLEPLKWSDDAARIARLHSKNMATEDFFSHKDLNGLMVNDRADLLGVRKWQAIGENIAYNQGFENPVEFAVERWMKSPKHRDNVLNSRWKESGIGVAVAANGTYYFTEVFLLRK